MEAILWAWVVALNPRRIGLIPASILLQGYPDFRHDRAMIGPRSGVNHDAQASSIARRSMGDESAPIPRHNLLDRAAIVEFFHDRPSPFDCDLAGWTIAIGLIPCAAIVRRIYRWPSDGDPAV